MTATSIEDPVTTNNIESRGATVSCEGLWKVYGPRPEKFIESAHDSSRDDEHTAAVRDLSFAIAPGETFVVMGLSGSGKSTLIRCLTRLIEPTAGKITIDDASVTDMSTEELRDLRRNSAAMVFQHFGLLPHRRVLDNTAYGLEINGTPRAEREARAREILELVGLKGWERKYPSELSGGMRQRVGLARALAVNPRLLLLDEPFSALDPLIRRELQDELLRLANVVKQTSVFITHDMSEALKVGDRIAVMRDGEFVQIGTPEEIVLSPADDYVRRFAGEAPRLRVVQAGTVAFTPAFVPVGMLAGEASRAVADDEYALVVDEGGRPKGALSSTEIRLQAVNVPVGELPLRQVATVTPGTCLEEAVRPLADGHLAVAVVDGHGVATGAIDRAHVIQALVDQPHEERAASAS
ncbi:glycine betaine/L-proline transport ATP binding subunit [Streptomyces sp. HGB0020]|nr:betaine/proline/choline family ABC transporter ATP-binding protein [Streptomyces sp. HGB0020]EPD69489.1 glycine betaine/L-proline transport ATP binding subunit [Streptomyces sp. HGB0020]